jgi:hypothetical protein
MKKTTTTASGRRKATKQSTPVRTKRVVRKPAAANTQAATAEQGLPKVTKKDTVLGLLQRDEGASLQELMTATGWQAHSVRGFVSGTLRKKLGLAVSAGKNQAGQHVYRVTA